MRNRRLAVIAIAFAALAALPATPALADPCVATQGAAGVIDLVCVDGRTALVAHGLVANVEDGSYAGVRFVNFDVAGEGFVIVSRGGAPWSSVLPADDVLKLRGSNAGADAVVGAYKLLQLRTPMLPEWSDALAAADITVHAYVPENAFLVRAPEGVPALPFVRAVTALAPTAKVEPGLADEGGLQMVNVLTVPGAPGAHDEAIAAISDVGVLLRDETEIERLVAIVPADALLTLAATPGIMWIDRASDKMQLDMDQIRIMVGAEHLENLAVPFSGEGVVGMVMDNGLETTHQDFGALLAVDGANEPAEHGTSVFGIVFGSGAGDAKAIGMAPDARGVFASWFPQTRYEHAQNLRDNWSGVFQTNSWHHVAPLDNTYDSYSNENDRVVRDLDVLMLQAMGNYGPFNACREAMAKNILSVGGIIHRDTTSLVDDTWTAPRPASTGPAADGRIKPELAAPYEAIYTTSMENGYTTSFGGTSGATPIVAGAVALTTQMYRDGVFAGSSGTPKPATLKALLMASAEQYLPYQMADFPLPQAKLMGRDKQGWGLPDLQALHAAGASALVVDGSVPLVTGQSASYSYTPAIGALATRISLVWTDVPADPGASKTLVNDLDLEVRDATGQVVFLGNVGLRDLPFSQPGGEADRTNNVENVYLPAEVVGPLTITVRAASVNLDAVPGTATIDQDFALVALSIA